MVFMGDSLSAGFQNFSLLDSQQKHGYPSIIATQARTPIVLPLIGNPGVPNVLQLISAGPPPVITPALGTPPFLPRTNPLEQPTNLGVPGMFLTDLLNKRPGAPELALPDVLTDLVLGFPTPLIIPGPPQSQVEQAIALHPTTIVLWAGNNDILFPELFGPATFPITPVSSFDATFNQILDSLAPTGARIVVANIPDITLIPYFTPVAKFAEMAHVPVGYVTTVLGIGAGDSLRPGALPLAGAILSGSTPGPLPAICPPPMPFFPPVPCVMSAAEAGTARATVLAYNAAIRKGAANHGATLVDMYSLVNSVASKGYEVAGRRINLDFLGGFVSLDGMHPTNTGYAILANEFIKTMNREMAAGIPPVSIEQVAKDDPLLQPK